MRFIRSGRNKQSFNRSRLSRRKRVAVSLLLFMLLRRAVIRRRRRPLGRKWTKDFNSHENRRQYSFYFTLLKDAMENDHETFFKFTRMYPPQFFYLVELLHPVLAPQELNFRASISVEERLAVTLRFLATGESFQSLGFAFRMGKSTVAGIVKFTCKALYNQLAPIYLLQPSTPEEWQSIADGYNHYWNFPHCLGAMDGKHVRIKAPRNGGSAHYNYKSYHSIVFLALCDSQCRFTYADIGAPGRLGDATVFHSSNFKKELDAGDLGLPKPRELPYSSSEAPYVLVADEAFPLSLNIMRPYSGRSRTGLLTQRERIFNYRLSRARRIIENAFGILVARWRVFKTEIACKRSNVTLITRAAVALHNFMITTNSSTYCPPSYVDKIEEAGRIRQKGHWTTTENCMSNFRPVKKHRNRDDANSVRETFTEYFNTENTLEWQEEWVNYDGREEDYDEYDTNE